MALRTIRVRAVGDRQLPYLAPDGIGIVGRLVGRDYRKGQALLADGEEVHEDPYYTRALACGDLELVTDASAPEVTIADKAAE